MKNKIKAAFSYIIFCLMITGAVVSASPLEAVLETEKNVPIIMYHYITNKRLGTYRISPQELESDLKYLKENGYETVFMSELIDFVHDGKNLPEKPIVLTFDDGDSGIDTYVLPLLEKYDAKAVVSIMGKITDEYSDSSIDEKIVLPNLRWTQVNKLLDSGRVEIQNHSYDLHKGIGAKRVHNESEDSYKKRLTADAGKLQERITEMTDTAANTFTYPLGAISASSDEILKEMGFSATLSCYEKINMLSVGDNSCLYSMKRLLRPHGVGAGQVLRKAEVV